jgi:bifunctional non-homologous end joining protein LigD
MLAKGDLKFRLKGKRLNGDFALIKMKGRRPGSKGNEWLMIKKHDDHEVGNYDIDHYDSSVLSKRSMDEIAGDQASAEWRSRPSGGGGRVKAAWLADAIKKFDQKKVAEKKAGPSTIPAKKKATAKSAKAKPPEIRAIATEKKTANPRRKSA